MKKVLQWVIWVLAALVLGLRYRVKAQGLEQLRGLKKAIIVPQHPAYMDPPLVLRTLYGVARPRPMLFEDIFKNPLLFWLPWALDALKIPNMEGHSAAARAQAEGSIKEVIAGLKRGETFILWPSGRVQRQGWEMLGAARSLADILQAVPDVQVVAIRTRGLWGSSFSYAYTGQRVELVKAILRGVGWLAANLLFFAPRRRVEMTVQVFKPGDLPGVTREKVNPFLEAWYNAPGPEEPKFVPYHWVLGAREYVYPKLAGRAAVDVRLIGAEVKEAVNQMLAEQLKRELQPGELQPEVQLEALGLDSLDRMELSLAVEGRFGFAAPTVPVTVGELWALGAGMVEAGEARAVDGRWFTKPPAGHKLGAMGETIGEAFVKRALASRGHVIAADDLSGTLTYERLLVGALLVGKRIHAIPARNVGLLLPASVGADLVFLAMHLAGKLPIVLNWTTGPANLAHAVELTGVTHVITSKKFIDRTGMKVPGAEFVYLEDLRKGIGKVEAIWTLLKVRWMGGGIVRHLPDTKPGDPAVVLFTSGSEKAPKAVPLSHRNILSNVRSVMEAYELPADAVMLGFLPVFHSFGITITTVLPLVSGLRIVHHPDPTDAAGLVRKIAMYKPTIVCGTPTFVSYILEKAKGDELASLKLVVVGAEKCPEALFERVEKKIPGAIVLEGYGITECAPLVSGNRPHAAERQRGTIGKPVPGVSLAVVDPDSMQPVAAGALGMLLVAGENVFAGYLGKDQPNPFHEMEGRRWYITGDLAKIDEKGFVWFAGRLKRFLKAGGEMISLPALEEPLAAKFPPVEGQPQVAVEGVETPGGRRIVLFTTQDLTLRDANAILQAYGFRGVMRLDEVRKAPAIPVLGTGKTDYKMLRKEIES